MDDQHTNPWEQLLDRYLQDLKSWAAGGSGPSLRDFDEEVRAAQQAAQCSVDEVLHDGLRIRVPQTMYRPGYMDPVGSLRPGDPRPEVISATRVLGETSMMLRGALLADGVPSPDDIRHLERALDVARRARHDLNSLLMEEAERTAGPE